MPDPVTATIILDIANSSITLVNALVQVVGDQKGKRKPKAAPTLSAFIGALPGAAQNGADTIKAQISILRQDCISAGLNLGNTIGTQSPMLDRSGERMRDRFLVRVESVVLRTSIFLDDVATLARFLSGKPLEGTERTSARKATVRDGTTSDHTLREILDTLDGLVDNTREQLSDM